MNKKNILNIIIIFLILGIIVGIIWEKYKEYKIENKKTVEYSTQNLSTSKSNEPKNNEEIIEKDEENTLIVEITKEYPKEEIIDEYKGYDVIAKLKIPEIKLETYVLKNYSVNALNISATKFWGVNPNEIGNFCVAGHNFKNKNMFRNLKNLKIGNKIFVSDNVIGKIQYEIYDLYKVEPEDVNCLSQKTNGKREVTLITCTSDSKKRIIVKAREVQY